jgi:hypothetical protein
LTLDNASLAPRPLPPVANLHCRRPLKLEELLSRSLRICSVTAALPLPTSTPLPALPSRDVCSSAIALPRSSFVLGHCHLETGPGRRSSPALPPLLTAHAKPHSARDTLKAISRRSTACDQLSVASQCLRAGHHERAPHSPRQASAPHPASPHPRAPRRALIGQVEPTTSRHHHRSR